MKDVLLTLFSVCLSLVFLLLAVVIGWFIVWKLFLSRFKFVRELLGGINDSNNKEEPKPKPKKARRE